MHTASRRFCAIVIALLMGLPPLTYAAEKPVAWFALRSYQRLEQRLREFSTMAKTPGLAEILLGMVQLQLAGLGGLDRQRPLGVIVPTVSVTETPPMAVVLPYTDKEAMLQTLRGFFPQTIVEAGDRLSLQGGPMPAFGYLDAPTSTVVVATTPESAKGVDVSFPADLFGAQDSGPDLVLRVDLERAKQRLDTAWKAMLANLEQFWQSAAQQAAKGQGASAADTAAMTAYMQTMQKGLRQGLDDLFRGEIRLTLAPTGWVFDLESRMRPGSPSATFLNQQAGHASRAAHLFSPDAALRVTSNVRMTETLRQEFTTLRPAFRQMFEARLAALPALTQEQRTAGTQAITAYFALFDKWMAQKEIESAVEMRIQDATSIALTGWAPLPDSTDAIGTLLDFVEKLPLLTEDAVAQVSRNVLRHRDIAVHRIDLPQAHTPEMPGSVFIAAPSNSLAFHLGTSPASLTGLLDRLKTVASQPPTQTDALYRLELFLAPILKLAASKGQIQDPAGRALMERLQQGPHEPLLLEMLTRQDSATLRYLTPGPVVQGVAEVVGQQIMQQLRGGSGNSSGGSGSGKAGNKPRQ